MTVVPRSGAINISMPGIAVKIKNNVRLSKLVSGLFLKNVMKNSVTIGIAS